MTPKRKVSFQVCRRRFGPESHFGIKLASALALHRDTASALLSTPFLPEFYDTDDDVV